MSFRLTLSWPPLERVARCARLLALSLSLAAPGLHAQALNAKDAPDAFIAKLSNHLLDIVKADAGLRAGDLVKINALVNDKVAPHVNFERMTASAVGPAWRQATPEQRKQLIDEFKLLLVRSYSGALSQVKDQKLVVKRSRFSPEDPEVVIRTEIVGGG